jgi:hypothetical protein
MVRRTAERATWGNGIAEWGKPLIIRKLKLMEEALATKTVDGRYDTLFTKYEIRSLEKAMNFGERSTRDLLLGIKDIRTDLEHSPKDKRD